jgi:hypothetical protein
VAAAPFSPTSEPEEPEDVPAWLIALAIGLIAAVAIGLASAASTQLKGKPGF